MQQHKIFNQLPQHPDTHITGTNCCMAHAQHVHDRGTATEAHQQCWCTAPVESCHPLFRHGAPQGGPDAWVLQRLRLSTATCTHMAQIKDGCRFRVSMVSLAHTHHTTARQGVATLYDVGGSLLPAADLNCYGPRKWAAGLVATQLPSGTPAGHCRTLHWQNLCTSPHHS